MLDRYFEHARWWGDLRFVMALDVCQFADLAKQTVRIAALEKG